MRNLYVAELRYAEKMYYFRQGCKLSSNELKGFSHRWWSVAKSACELINYDSIPPIVDNGRVVISAFDKPECLKKTFPAKCSGPSVNPPVPSLDRIGAKFTFSTITVAEVVKRLASLNAWKASGLDELPNRFLRECRRTIAGPLTHIFNFSISTGVFPLFGRRE